MHKEGTKRTIEEEQDLIIAGHFAVPDTYVSKRPHGRKDWLMIYTLGGEGYAITPNMQVTCRAGDVTLLKPDIPQHYGTREGAHWDMVWVHFSDQRVEKHLLPHQEIHQQSIENESAQNRIRHAFERIITDSTEGGPYAQELGYNALREILMLLAQRDMQKRDARVEEVLFLLSQHIREPLKVDAIARKVGLSPSRLSHVFKENTGCSIVEMLNQMRIRQAALLLRHTDRSAFEVSQDVGFHNYNHFINQFRKYIHMTPSAYREQQ